MGLFDRFRKRVHEVADETDDKALSVEATSEEAQALIRFHRKVRSVQVRAQGFP